MSGVIDIFDSAYDAAARADIAAHVADDENPHDVDKDQVGLGNVDNTSDANKPVSTATATALALKAPLASPALTGTPTAPTAAPGTATTQLATTAFAQAAANIVAAALDVDEADLATHKARVDNPHSVTKTQVGLGNVDNTSDANKPISSATQAALNTVMAAAAAVATDLATHEADTSNPHAVTKTQIGLGSVDNTSDANKPVSAAQQTALNLKAPLASPTFTGTPAAPTAAPGTNTTQVATTAYVEVVAAALAAHDADTANPHIVTKAQVGLSTVDNTSDADKPVSTAQATALALKAPLASPALTGVPTAPTAALGTNTTQIATAALARAGDMATRVAERPGDAVALYGASKTGTPVSTTPIDAAWIATSAAGSVVRVDAATAADPQTIATATAFPIETGHVYEIRYKVQRQTDPGDPLNDSVTLGIRWLENDKDGVAGGSGTTTVEDIALTVADGIEERVVRVATLAGDDIDHVAPAGSIYFRPFVDLFGDSHVTDVIVIAVRDATDVSQGTIDLGNEEAARIAADLLLQQGWAMIQQFGGDGVGDDTAAITAAEASAFAHTNLRGLTVTTTHDRTEIEKGYFHGQLVADGGIRIKPRTPFADEHLQRRRNKSPLSVWAGESVLWLGTSIPHQGVGADGYPELFGAALDCTVTNMAWAGSHAYWDADDNAFEIETVKALSMTEDDRLAMIAIHGATSAYHDDFVDPATNASTMTLDYRVKAQFAAREYACVMLDHNHNDRLREPGTLTPTAIPIVDITLGATTTIELASAGLVAVGDGVVLDVGGIAKLNNFAGRVISISTNTFVLNIDSAAFTGTFVSGTVTKHDRNTIYGTFQFIRHYILWAAAYYDYAAPAIVFSGAPSEYTNNVSDFSIWSIASYLRDIAEKWGDSFFDIAYEFAVTARDQIVWFPDGVHPDTSETRQAIANHWIVWAMGGAPKIANPSSFLARGGVSDLIHQREALYSRFHGGFATPTFIIGAPTTVLDEDFTSGLGSYTLVGTAPVVVPAPWDAGENAVRFVSAVGATTSYLERAVALDDAWSIEFDLWLPVVSGLTAINPATVQIVAIRSTGAYYQVELIARPAQISPRITYFKTPNTTLVIVPTDTVPLQADTQHRLKVEAVRATGSALGGLLFYLDDVLIAGPIETDDSGQTDPATLRIGITSSNTGDDLTLYIGNLLLTKSATHDYTDRLIGSLDAGETGTVVNGVITGKTVTGAILPELASDPVAGPGAGKARLYVVEGASGKATLRMQAGTSATPIDLAIDVGSGF